jgi:hypothetical protein
MINKILFHLACPVEFVLLYHRMKSAPPVTYIFINFCFLYLSLDIPINRIGTGASKQKVKTANKFLKLFFITLQKNNSPDKIGVKQIFLFNTSFRIISLRNLFDVILHFIKKNKRLFRILL